MSNEKEYIVTLKNKEDLDDFYYDMETPGGNLYIPNRSIDVINRRPVSRNTHYSLTDAEAEQLRQDSRVLSVETLPDPDIIDVRPCWSQTSGAWYKGFTENNVYKNWGLLRCYEGSHRSGWGADGTTTVTGTVNTGTLDGTGVDVIIVDGLFDPNHPEFAVNNDGSGGSRVVQYNWLGYQGGSYNYGSYTGSDAGHGCHTAGTVAGNDQGWARGADIYNIDFAGTGAYTFYDHVRVWHNAKTNGRPTITNNSWSWGSTLDISNITSVFWRGQTYNGPFTSTSIEQFGIPHIGSNLVRSTYQHAATDADFLDAYNDGIISVAAAGNDNLKITTLSDPFNDYDNYILYGGSRYYYNRPSSPATHSIVVGAASFYSREERATFSMSGPRVDIWAPGVEIQSSRHSDYGNGTPDPRNSNYYLEKISGTSMATPQVCGYLACHLQNNPGWNRDDALNFLISNATTGQLYDNGITSGVDTYSLFGAPNRYLAWPGSNNNPPTPPTLSDGFYYPIFTKGTRQAAGMLYPRKSIIYS
jgi:hypothetical protein